MLWIESQISLQHAMQGEQEKAGKNNQCERERNLYDYKACTNFMLFLRRARGGARFKRMIGCRLGGTPCRNQTRANAGKYASAQRKGYDVNIQVDVIAPHEGVREEYFHRGEQEPGQ